MKKTRRPSRKGSPGIEGNLEISRQRSGIFIGGERAGLRSFAKLLTWLADFDQESHPTMPDGERCHVHLQANAPVTSFNSLTSFSVETEVRRLDGKGTGEFPKKNGKKPRGRPVVRKKNKGVR